MHVRGLEPRDGRAARDVERVERESTVGDDGDEALGRVEESLPSGGTGFRVQAMRGPPWRRRRRPRSGLGRGTPRSEDVAATGHFGHVDEGDGGAEIEDSAEVFAGEGIEESPGMAHTAGFDEESVGLGAAENLGDGDGERGGDGAAETSAGDLTNNHAAVAAAGGGGAVGTRDDPAGCVDHGPVDAERTELVHHDGPALVGGRCDKRWRIVVVLPTPSAPVMMFTGIIATPSTCLARRARQDLKDPPIDTRHTTNCVARPYGIDPSTRPDDGVPTSSNPNFR